MALVQSLQPHRVSLGDLTPVEAAAGLRHLPGLVFFDSAREAQGMEARGQLSIVAARPVEVICGSVERDWGLLKAALNRWRVDGGVDDGLPHGFAAGCVGYDGAFEFGVYPEALFFRHDSGSWDEIGGLSQELRTGSRRGDRERRGDAPPGPRFAAEIAKDQFCQMVARAQEYIGAGDIYQVNLAHRFAAQWDGDPFRLYENLRERSPAPFAAYLAQSERTILSTSPESFLRLSGNLVRTRPIKGTRPRWADPQADEKSAYDLITSAKEQAELVMITDLLRNDLGKVCEWGSVRVTELLALERFAQVFHLVSTIEGRLRPEVDHLAALGACFPGGSITGAPKLRAREIIAELEPRPRGLYTGAIGWLGFNGESQFNIAIRTVVAERAGETHFHVGAGVVADSSPEREWQETLDKAAGILLAAEGRE
jgi:aminodeoxychorismate synthase component I